MPYFFRFLSLYNHQHVSYQYHVNNPSASAPLTHHMYTCQLEEGTWKMVESDGDDWVYFWVLNASDMAHDCFAGPGLTFDSGVVEIQLARNIGRCTMLNIFLGFEDGSHVKAKSLERIKARALRFEALPKHGGDHSKGRMVIDGELVDEDVLQMEVCPGMGRLIRMPEN